MVRLKKYRLVVALLLLTISVTLAQKSLQPGDGACKGCGSLEMCIVGGNYTGTGYFTCTLVPNENGGLDCNPTGFGMCTYHDYSPQ